MSRRRRGVLLIGLALVLGGLAATDVSRREAALDRRLAPMVPVVVARSDLRAGRALTPSDLSVQEIPQRWAPQGAAGAPGQVAGATLAVALPGGAYVTTMDLASAAQTDPVGRGERAVEILATGSTDLIEPGSRVDVLVTRESEGTRLALQDVEVLAAHAAPATASDGQAGRIAATLRVTLRQAVYLTAAEAFAKDVRLLPRSAGDNQLSGAVAVGEGLG